MMYHFFVQQQLVVSSNDDASLRRGDNIIDMEPYVFIIGLCLCFGDNFCLWLAKWKYFYVY